MFVSKFFDTNAHNKFTNCTRIVLIPKKTQTHISLIILDLLSLCNASYKIISNILVNRIRPLMNDDLISPLQIAFVPKRLISDNISLAHELQIQKM